MSIMNSPELWLNAAVDAVNDFVSMGLGEEGAQALINDSSPVENLKMLSGSSLVLSCSNEQIEIGLLADPQNIKMITQKMLSLSPEEGVDKEQMSDALNEALNIISGGIKSRLNDKADGGIVLGLPKFIDNPQEAYRVAQLLQYITVGDLSMGVSVHVI